MNIVYEYDASAGTAYYYGLHRVSAGNSQYYLYNAHGDVVQLTDGTGAVTKSYAYDAFGNEVNPSANDTNPFRYCGEYYDVETGTIYLRARYYDPAIGRFTQQDAWAYFDASDPLGLNLYTYCANNPISHIDPNGTYFESFWDIMNVFADVIDIGIDIYVGDFWSLLYDIPALVVDGATVIIPIVPGFAGAVKTPARIGKTVKAFDKVADTIKAGDKLGIIAKAFLRREAREFLLENSTDFMKAVKAGQKLEVHHIIPLEWAHLMGEGFDPNTLANLAGVPKDIHQVISSIWTAFRKKYKDTIPQVKDIIAQVHEINELYGKYFIQ